MPVCKPGVIRAAITLVLLVLTGLTGCSTTEPVEQPAPVPETGNTVSFRTLWSRTVGDGHDGELLYLSPLNTGDRIYAASADGELVAVSPDDGELLWKQELGERIFAGVGGDSGHLYLVTRDAELLALDRDGGEEVWRAALPTEVLSAPQSNGAMVVVQTIDGRVLAFDSDSGDSLWQYDGVVPVLSIRVAAPPLVGQDVVIAAFASGKLIALNAESGQPVWQYQLGQPQGRTELERLVDIGGQPLVLGTALLAVGYQGNLALIDIRTGQEIWARKASSLYAPAVADNTIYLASANGDLVALRGSDRRELWVQDQLSWRQITQPVPYEDYLVVGDFEGYLYAVSRSDGSLQGRLEFDDEGIRVPVQRLASGHLLVFGNGGRLAALQLRPSE